MSALYPAPVYPLEFDEQSFSGRARLARYLSSLTKRSANAIALMLTRLGDDPVVVLNRYRQWDDREFARIGTRCYPTRRDFSRYVARYFCIPTSTVEYWLRRGQSVDEVLARAKERHAQLPPSNFPNPRHPVTIFGWRFRSYNAMCRYYRRGSRPPEGWREEWVQRVAEGRIPVHFLPLLEAIIRRWHWGELDERNRFLPEIELRELYRWLPLNAEPEAVTDKFERSLIDALQADDQMTLRRSCLRKLGEQRTRDAQSQGRIYD